MKKATKLKATRPLASEHQPCRNAGPVPATIEARKNHQQEEAGEDDRHDNFLRGLGFGPGPDLHAAFDQLGIVFQEIDRDRGCARDKDEAVEPSLPVAQRAGRREQQYAQEQYRQGRSEQRVASGIGRFGGHFFLVWHSHNAASADDLCQTDSIPDLSPGSLDSHRRFPLEAWHRACG